MTSHQVTIASHQANNRLTTLPTAIGINGGRIDLGGGGGRYDKDAPSSLGGGQLPWPWDHIKIPTPSKVANCASHKMMKNFQNSRLVFFMIPLRPKSVDNLYG